MKIKENVIFKHQTTATQLSSKTTYSQKHTFLTIHNLTKNQNPTIKCKMDILENEKCPNRKYSGEFNFESKRE